LSVGRLTGQRRTIPLDLDDSARLVALEVRIEKLQRTRSNLKLFETVHVELSYMAIHRSLLLGIEVASQHVLIIRVINNAVAIW